MECSINFYTGKLRQILLPYAVTQFSFAEKKITFLIVLYMCFVMFIVGSILMLWCQAYVKTITFLFIGIVLRNAYI